MTDQTSPAKGLTSEELDELERRVNDPRTWGLSLELSEARALIASARSATVSGEGESLQARVQPWMTACFGAEIAADRLERNDRFIEEALELVQASGYDKARAHELVEYVYGRPQGDINQEVGGVMITLAAHCLAHGVDMHEAGETELARIWTKVEQIREKQKSKPKGSALPIPQPTAPASDKREAVARIIDPEAWSILDQCGGDIKHPYLDQKIVTKHKIEISLAKVRAILALLQPTSPSTGEWLDIASAPKDGTRVDLRCGLEIHLLCYWSLCENSARPFYGWANAPEHWTPKHWRAGYAPPATAKEQTPNED
jgi:hypothetical protein